MALKFQKLRVAKVVYETEDAVTLYFENPDKQVFHYLPGQYLTLRWEIGDKHYNRAFSLCSSPALDDLLAVTVKKTPGGMVSPRIITDVKEGQLMEVMPPNGHFTAQPTAGQQKHYVLIGAGSGITPLMSILKTALAVEKDSQVTLLYGNRTPASIIFRKELEQLSAQNPERLKVIHALTQPDESWTGPNGRLTRGKVKELLEPVLQSGGLKKEFFVCGPPAMMDEALHALRDLQIPAEQVKQEHFTAPITHPLEAPVAEATDTVIEQQVTVILEGEEKEITVSPNSSILEAALDADLDPPYACMIGSCTTCRAKLLSGKVIMDDREGLTDDEIAQGFVLTCQSHPVTAGVKVSYDEI